MSKSENIVIRVLTVNATYNIDTPDNAGEHIGDSVSFEMVRGTRDQLRQILETVNHWPDPRLAWVEDVCLVGHEKDFPLLFMGATGGVDLAPGALLAFPGKPAPRFLGIDRPRR